MKYEIGNLINEVDSRLLQIKNEKIIERIWEKDFTVWGSAPEEISNRLGWLDSPEVTRKSFNEILSFVNEIKAEGFTHALLLGMGGSSLAPEVFRFIFGVKEGYLDLSILDSTDPEAILEKAHNLDPEKTLYIVSTKSGGTVETISFMKYFYNYTISKVGKEKVAKHFIAITDPGSGLEKMARDLNFRKIFLNDPNIGGRFSALSLFGIVPAALVGVDIENILGSAEKEITNSQKSGDNFLQNDSATLGTIMGVLAGRGKDKITFIISPKISPFGAWAEQLIAESTGKIGKGILPVDLESLEAPEFYSTDRLFVYIKLKNDNTINDKAESLKSAGHPLIEIELETIYDLGREFFRWEFATAVAGHVLTIPPFDQPNVEQAKVIARQMMKEYQINGSLPVLTSSFQEGEVKIYGNVKTENISDALPMFLDKCKGGKNYVTIQAYLQPTKETTRMLQLLRTSIQKKYKVATTLGYGPRFLHSTGQLHKGDGGNGYFVQFIADNKADTPIPDNAGSDDSSITFGILKRAQLLGDRQALVDNKRKVITIDLGSQLKGLEKFLIR
jgi:glucose-6-phosphate isomerase